MSQYGFSYEIRHNNARRWGATACIICFSFSSFFNVFLLFVFFFFLMFFVPLPLTKKTIILSKYLSNMTSTHDY